MVDNVKGSIINRTLDIEVNSCISHHIVEMVAVMILSLVWFFLLCTWSYLINDLLPEYKKSETLGVTWAWLIVEILLTFVVFHFTIRIVGSISRAIFGKESKVQTLPEVHGSILAAFALVLFQTSISLRAKRVWISFFGETKTGEA